MLSDEHNQHDEVQIFIDNYVIRQPIEGFGVSGAWWAQIIGGWEDTKKNEIIDLLFDTEKGIGLNTYRYNIGGGSGEEIADTWRRSETFEVDKRVYDWTTDKNAMWVLKQAYKKGADKIVAFLNSPPGRMTISGSAAGHFSGKTNIEKSMYKELCSYIIDIIRHLREEEDIPVEWVSPINEPQWDWKIGKGQEGCHFEVEECAELIKTLLDEIEINKIEIKISPIDAGDWKNARKYFDILFNDDKVKTRLDHFSLHSYWSCLEDKKQFTDYVVSYYPGVRLWMSEWTEMKEGRDYGMESALNLANVVYEDLTTGNVTSWQYWIAVSKYDFRDGLIYVDENLCNIEKTKRLWALGNFSRFLRKNFNRIESESSDEKVNVVSFHNNINHEIVIVIINNRIDDVNVCIDIKTDKTFDDMHIFETSDSSDLVKTYSGMVKNRVCLSPKSVTTLVMK